MLATAMCSKNQEAGSLIRPIHNKSLFDSDSFSSFAKFAFQNKRPLFKKQNGAKSLPGKILLVFSHSLFIHHPNIPDLQSDFFMLFYSD